MGEYKCAKCSKSGNNLEKMLVHLKMVHKVSDKDLAKDRKAHKRNSARG